MWEGRATRRDEVRGNVVLVSPLVQYPGCELGAMIDHNPNRQPALHAKLLQNAHHAQHRQGRVHLDGQHLTSVCIFDRERAQLAAAGQRAVQKIHRPGLVGPDRRGQHTRAAGLFGGMQLMASNGGSKRSSWIRFSLIEKTRVSVSVRLR